MAISIQKSGDRRYDSRWWSNLGDCLSAFRVCRHERVLLQCLKISEKCIETIAQHSQQSKCADQAFGLKGKH